MFVIDEYMTVRVVLGDWPPRLPDDELTLPSTRHWRLLQALHSPRGGQLSQVLSVQPDPDRDVVRYPHPEVFQVVDPRPLLDEAAAIAARYGGTGLLIAETLAAGLSFGRQLWFGMNAHVGRVMGRAAGDLGIAVHVTSQY